jgi:ribosomal protein S12 methylthiotransferase
VVVNTCGFIDSAVDESLEAIGEALAENGKVIVTGCLGAQPQKILERHPQVLKITGPQRYEEVLASVHEHLPPQHEPFLDLIPAQGVKLTPRHYAYLKISEGCNHHCSFCIIPSMRGRLAAGRSARCCARRTAGARRREGNPGHIAGHERLRRRLEVRRANLARAVERRTRFYDLAEALGELGVWIRLHYVYPYPHVDRWSSSWPRAGAALSRHSLSARERADLEAHEAARPPPRTRFERIAAWRSVVPDITIRSTFIVGFPGRDRGGFRELLDWLRARSSTASAASNTRRSRAPRRMPCARRRCPDEVKHERRERFMELAAEISASGWKKKVGRTCACSSTASTAMSPSRAPQATRRRSTAACALDGGALKVGDWAEVRITECERLRPGGANFASLV